MLILFVNKMYPDRERERKRETRKVYKLNLFIWRGVNFSIVPVWFNEVRDLFIFFVSNIYRYALIVFE